MIYCLDDVEMVFFFFFDGLLKQLSFAKMKAASMERHGLCPKFKKFELAELLGPSSHSCKRF
jgi:hypothetical protein